MEYMSIPYNNSKSSNNAQKSTENNRSIFETELVAVSDIVISQLAELSKEFYAFDQHVEKL